MATGRILKTQISHSEQVNDLSLKAAFLFTWMIPHVDDFGRMPGSPRKVKAIVLPMRDDISILEVEDSLREMSRKGLILWYIVDGDAFIQLTTFETHQSGLHKRTKSKFPEPPEVINDDIPNSSGKFPEIPPRREEKRRETEENILCSLSDSPPVDNSEQPPKHKPKKPKHDARHEKFYKLYPNKMDKEASQKSFDRRNFSDEQFAEVMQALEKQIKIFDVNEKVGVWQPPWKLPATWLNKGSWENEVKMPDPAKPQGREGLKAWDLFFSTAARAGWDSKRIIMDEKTLKAVNKIGGVRTIGNTPDYQQHQLKQRFIEVYEAANEL